MLKIFLVITSLFLLTGCGVGKVLNSGDLEANLEKTDKIYGRCNNPNRQFTKVQKEVCVAQVRAAGPDGKVREPFNITEMIERYRNPKDVVYAGTSVNQYLWNGSLAVLADYPLKSVDSQGGYIATEWIFNKEVPDQRCVIKVNVNSLELISTGVNTNIVCEKKSDEQWYITDEKFIEEEKRITLKILEIAQELSITQTS